MFGRSNPWNSLIVSLIAILVVGVAGCGPAATTDNNNGTGKAASHGHHHDAPHGGALVALGGEAHTGHLEFVLDAEAGTLTLYVLDGEVSGAVRLKDAAIAVTVNDIHYADGRAMAGSADVSLAATASAATGETVGDSSQFSGSNALLKGATRFRISIPSIAVRGIEQGPLTVPFPEGLGEAHGDDHDDHGHDHDDHGHDH